MSNTKTKGKAPTKKRGPNDLEVTAQSEEDKAAAVARSVTSPTVRGAVTTQAFSKAFGETDLQSLVNELGKQCVSVRDGNLARAESLLTTHAHTLDAIFNDLARRAALNMGEYINAAERYLRLALKAQSQCRATLETLATIKNPPVIYARQANITNGPQQINNGTSPAHAGEKTSIEPNKLLEQQNEQRLDTGTQGAAIGADTSMATVG
jgi:phosphohistidine phosphatase SixA